MREKVIKCANQLGIEYIGFCDAKRDDALYSFLQKRRAKSDLAPFVKSDIETRVDPSKIFPGAKSIIVCLFPYYIKENEPKNVARYAAVSDYHKVAAKLLEIIAKELSGYKTLCLCDNHPLCDRFLAYKAGLGFFGKNNLLINEKYGSFFTIGCIITDAEISPDRVKSGQCIACGKCILSCPGGALGDNFEFDYQKCISYITQAGEINGEQKKILNSSRYKIGCDVCQNVCPHNEKICDTPIKEFYENKLIELSAEDIADISNKEFKKKYENFAFSYLGKSKILKNFTD